ncbi:Cro/Cl family transcriptional regulator [Roseateles aquatilis]|uniref:Cro/Cl family transcriptional regulator n=1 Tax=Roseateles aquatilis TaxID=431061 RepID=A0A246JDV8_9BURK|nr:short-chain fatty acyl-CoA regulator family protein [Roseateles aquatilis]OWQ90789.1 Cro/Cl family transcriptional regulator [Roseateles aquatilis]
MRKTFLGVKLKTLREQRGLTQAALAQVLKLSPSYVNQIENNERPLSVAVLLRLQSALGVDLQFFSEDDEARLFAQLHEIVAETPVPGGVPDAELRTLAQQMPGMAQLMLRLHGRARGAEQRVSNLGGGERDTGPAAGLGPHEEVRDFFYAHHNHMDALDRAAEALAASLAGDGPGSSRASGIAGTAGAAGPIGATGAASGLPQQDLAQRLESHLMAAHRIQVQVLPDERLRRFEPAQRLLLLSDALTPGQRAFQLATQLAYLECGGEIDRLIESASFSPEAAALARIGLASYFAGALVLPYRPFLAAAQELRHDIGLLAKRFGVSFETVCHRLSTLQRREARGVPFFFVRVDRAGNISKRQSATDFHFSRSGGTCPLWNVYEAFAQPGRVLTQVARMPDGRSYLWIAHCEVRATGGYGSPAREFAVGVGCDLRHAGQLVYAKGLDLGDPDSATPIGPGCKLCEREGCAQRAFPALGKRLRIDENERSAEPYAAR